MRVTEDVRRRLRSSLFVRTTHPFERYLYQHDRLDPTRLLMVCRRCGGFEDDLVHEEAK